MKYIFTPEQRRKGALKTAQFQQEKAAMQIESGTWNPIHSSLRTIKDYILRTRGHKCESCSLDSWQDNPIPLEIHHMNGNAKDNQLNNLQLICPNCHALTDSYKGKNKGKGTRKRGTVIHQFNPES
jgi:5-methylcytosine-specific restriction endonuclease McrA